MEVVRHVQGRWSQSQTIKSESCDDSPDLNAEQRVHQSTQRSARVDVYLTGGDAEQIKMSTQRCCTS